MLWPPYNIIRHQITLCILGGKLDTDRRAGEERRWYGRQKGNGMNLALKLWVMDAMVTVAWATIALIHFSAQELKVNDNLESRSPEESRRP